MVLDFLFGKKKEKKPTNEIEEIKNRVLGLESSYNQLSSYIQDEFQKIYTYLHQLHTDIDGIASVVNELKSSSKASGPNTNSFASSLSLLEQRVASLEKIADNISILGRVVLNNHERLNRTEAMVNEMLLAIDKLVDEVIKSSTPTIPDEAKSVEKAEATPRTEGIVSKKQEKSGKVKKSVESGESTTEVRKVSRISREREYLTELAKLRRELLELKSSV